MIYKLFSHFSILFIFNLFFSCSRDLEEVNVTEGKKLNPPQNLSVEYAMDGTISLNWSKSYENILGYRVYQAVNFENNTYYPIFVTEQTYIIIKNLNYDTTYFYKITVYNQNVESDFSNIVSGKPGDVYRPQMPYGLVVFGSNYENKKQMSLSWYPNPEGDILKYLIYRKVEINSISGEYEKINETPTNMFIDTNNLKAGYKYYYKIAAVDKANSISPISYEESDYILEKSILLSPEDLSLLSGNTIFKWEKVNNASGYMFVLSDSPYGNEIWSSTIENNNQGLQLILSSSILEMAKMYFWKVLSFSKSTSHPNSFSQVRSFYYYPQFLINL
jgi:hypothetical protein